MCTCMAFYKSLKVSTNGYKVFGGFFYVYKHIVLWDISLIQKFREKSKMVGDSFKVVAGVCNTLSIYCLL